MLFEFFSIAANRKIFIPKPKLISDLEPKQGNCSQRKRKGCFEKSKKKLSGRKYRPNDSSDDPPEKNDDERRNLKTFSTLVYIGKLFNEMLAVIGFYFGGFYLKETIS